MDKKTLQLSGGYTDTLHNDTQHKDTQCKCVSQQSNIQHNDTPCKMLSCWVSHFIIGMLSVIMISVTMGSVMAPGGAVNVSVKIIKSLKTRITHFKSLN